jgi:hypothetical protein
MNTLKELFIQAKVYENEKIKIFIDNDMVFSIGEHGKFTMHPEEALIEALELLGFDVEYV